MKKLLLVLALSFFVGNAFAQGLLGPEDIIKSADARILKEVNKFDKRSFKIASRTPDVVTFDNVDSADDKALELNHWVLIRMIVEGIHEVALGGSRNHGYVIAYEVTSPNTYKVQVLRKSTDAKDHLVYECTMQAQTK